MVSVATEVPDGGDRELGVGGTGVCAEVTAVKVKRRPKPIAIVAGKTDSLFIGR
jgi:hypothetical protein